MIETYWCHNATCPYQCKIVVSTASSTRRIRVPDCLQDYDLPNWKPTPTAIALGVSP
jgi:hypothetical protein